MNEVSLDEAKAIVAERVHLPTMMFPHPKGGGRDEALFKFTRLIMKAEVGSIPEIDQLCRVPEG